MDEQDADRPEESSRADVTLVTRGLTVTACVEVSTRSLIVVRPAGGFASAQAGAVGNGDKVELYWVSGYEERTLPALVTAVEAGPEPRWHLVASGPAERSQRRKAVRGRVALPVVIPYGGALVRGTSIDLSEGGVKAVVGGWGLPPDPGTVLDLTVELEDGPVDLRGELAWHTERGAQWMLAVRFVDVPDAVADQLRRRVFRALREERAAVAG